jgi:hypothetical protein
VNRKKTRTAAAATILGLGGLTGIALSAGGRQANTLADKPLIHTKVIHRTVHVTKHLKPKHPIAGGSAHGAGSSGSSYGSATTGASSTGGGSYSSSPVSTGASSTGSPSGSHSSPVVTHTSGSSHAGSGGGNSAPVTTSPSSTGGSTGGGGTTPVTTGPSGTGGTGGEVEDEGGDGGGD